MRVGSEVADDEVGPGGGPRVGERRQLSSPAVQALQPGASHQSGDAAAAAVLACRCGTLLLAVAQLPTRQDGGARAEAEVPLNAAGRQFLEGLCGVEEDVLARALPSWAREDAKLPPEKTECRRQRGGSAARSPGPAAFG